MTAQLSPTPVQKFFDNNGFPLFNGQLFTYAAGTTTPQATYVDSTQTTQNTNPIILNARGECNLWLDPTKSYKLVLQDFFGNTIWTVDNYANPGNAPSAVVDSGTLNNVVLTVPLLGTPQANAVVFFKAANTNTSAVTMTVNGQAKPLTWQNLAGLNGGEIQANGWYAAVFDGTQWQLQGPSLQPPQMRTAAEIAAGVTPTNYAYPVGHVLRYGVVGNGVADDTAALQNAYNANPGLTVDHGNGLTIIISANVSLSSGTRYTGKSAIKQKNGVNIGGGASANMLTATSCSNIIFENLEIDGNAANNVTGLVHGIQFIGGTNNTIRNCNIHDLVQAGIFLDHESASKVIGNQVNNCGRNLGTDNHGIMLAATSGTLTNIVCQGNTVINPYRKGITTFSSSPGTVVNVEIVGNVITGAGLGGIYVANAVGATAQSGINVTGNICTGCAVNIQVGSCTGLVCDGNFCTGSTNDAGIFVNDVTGGSVSGNTVISSFVAGIRFGVTSLANNLNITCNGNTILQSNQSSAGFGPGINAANVQYSTFVGNVIDDESGSPKQTHGIVEQNTSDFNLIQNNQIAHVTSVPINVAGAHTVYQLQQITGSAQALSNGSTVVINGGVTNANAFDLIRLSAAAAVTGVILPVGTYAGQEVVLINESAAANTITMAAAGTSNVADGISCVIAGLTQKTFRWNTGTSLWYHQ
jgi:parallel beta-helix repeat protein